MKKALACIAFVAAGHAHAMFGADEIIGQASATFTTGNDLYAMAPTLRLAYVRAVTDALMLTRSDLFPAPCLPEQVTLGQLDSVVYQSLVQDPATRHHPAQFLTYKALRKAFPCSSSPPPR